MRSARSNDQSTEVPLDRGWLDAAGKGGAGRVGRGIGMQVAATISGGSS